MEGPLLTKSEHIVDVTIHGDSSSTDGQTQHEAEGVQSCNPCANVWNSINFVVTLAQILAVVVFLTLSKDEQHPQDIFLTLVIGYMCASIVTLPVLCWRFWQSIRRVSSGSRINEVIDRLEKMLQLFFVGWVVMVVWHLIYSPALDLTSQLMWLCLAFLAISCIRDVIPNFPCAVICILFTVMGRILQLLDILDNVDSEMTYYYAIAFCVIGIIVCICNRCICQT